jgi:hypothetical protein
MKAMLAVFMIITSLSVSAQGRSERGNGRIVLRDGNTTVRISVNDRDDLHFRVRMLEEAVRDLQAQVYDLRDVQRTRVITTHVCMMNTTFNGSFVGRASTRIEAEANVRNNCIRGGREAFCGSNRIACSIVEEVVNL